MTATAQGSSEVGRADRENAQSSTRLGASPRWLGLFLKARCRFFTATFLVSALQLQLLPVKTSFPDYKCWQTPVHQAQNSFLGQIVVPNRPVQCPQLCFQQLVQHQQFHRKRGGGEPSLPAGLCPCPCLRPAGAMQQCRGPLTAPRLLLEKHQLFLKQSTSSGPRKSILVKARARVLALPLRSLSWLFLVVPFPNPPTKVRKRGAFPGRLWDSWSLRLQPGSEATGPPGGSGPARGLRGP